MTAESALQFDCPFCRKRIRVSAELAGRQAKCPNVSCKRSLRIPTVIETLQSRLRDPDPEVAAAAVEALAGLGTPHAVFVVCDAFENEIKLARNADVADRILFHRAMVRAFSAFDTSDSITNLALIALGCCGTLARTEAEATLLGSGSKASAALLDILRTSSQLHFSADPLAVSLFEQLATPTDCSIGANSSV